MKHESIWDVTPKQQQAHEGMPLTEKQKLARENGNDGYDFSFGDEVSDETLEKNPKETLQ
jgi:hypothetical protein